MEGVGLEDGFEVIGEGLGFFLRALCPGSMRSADWRGGLSGAFEVFCSFPEGIDGARGRGEALEEGLDVMMAVLLEKVLEVLCSSVEGSFGVGRATALP
jgi:hypothetical protein